MYKSFKAPEESKGLIPSSSWYKPSKVTATVCKTKATFTGPQQRPQGVKHWFRFSTGVRTQTMVKDMMEEAGIPGNFTNYSLRATSITTLFDASVPKALIQEKSGQKSSKALRLYEWVTPEQNLAISKILHSETKISYDEVKATSSIDLFNPDQSYSEEDLKLFELLLC